MHPVDSIFSGSEKLEPCSMVPGRFAHDRILTRLKKHGFSVKEILDRGKAFQENQKWDFVHILI